MVRKTWWDVPPEHAYKHRVLLISKGPYCSYHSRSRCSRKPWQGLYFPPYFPWGWSAKTMRGSLFPLFLLFWWPMSIHPVKTWTTKIGEIGTLSVFSLGEVPKPWVPISPISPKGEVPKPWEGPYFHYFFYFGGQCLFILSRHGPPK